MDAQELIDDLNGKKWVALSALIIGTLVRLVKDDTKLALFGYAIMLPAKWRPALSLALGVASIVLNRVAGGYAWTQSVEYGLIAGLLPIACHEVVVEGMRGGKEFPVPGLTHPPMTPPPPPPVDSENGPH